MADVVKRQHGVLARRLILVFFAWKTLLLLLAAFAPGPGYDTSSLILRNSSSHRHSAFKTWSRLDRLALNLFRWDALYFIKSAERDNVHEQEWAFSWAFSLLLKSAGNALSGNADPSLQHYVWAGIAASNIFHLISVLVLFSFLNLTLGSIQHGQIPFVASVLHIMSPAGLFLCAPYTEALFSALNFTGMLHYARASIAEGSSVTRTIGQDSLLLSSGLLFAGATLIRSNGLLSGLVYLHDVAGSLPWLWSNGLSTSEIRRIVVTCVSGSFIAIGFILPQYVAYEEYCMAGQNSEARPWCHRRIPSIYTWVQDKYWNVGFLRYWTLSNLPLFIIAAPMLWLLFWSSVTHLRCLTQQLSKPTPAPPTRPVDKPEPHGMASRTLPQLAWPQLVLSVTAATTFHVQIINRISSGYPLWYLSIAQWMTAYGQSQGGAKKDKMTQCLVRGLIMYALIHGVLFASFLPPA